MNYKRVILWALPVWVIVTVFWIGVDPFVQYFHDNHGQHLVVEPTSDGHLHFGVTGEEVADWIDQWMPALDALEKFSWKLGGLALAIGNIVAIIKGRRAPAARPPSSR